MLSFTALADPTRFQIVEMLARQGRMPVAQISRQFALSAPAVSQHLKVLKNANLVSVEVKAQQRIYMLNPDGLSDIENWLGRLRRMWEKRFDAFDAVAREVAAKEALPKTNKTTKRKPSP